MTDQSIDILLVEDNPSDVQLTLHALQEHTIARHVRVARDGPAALDFLLGAGPDSHGRIPHRPKLILLDLKLPLLDGIEVLRRIKADPRTSLIPVVVLTTSREDQDIMEIYRLGANSYIVKPVDFDRFAEAMSQIALYWLHHNQPPLSNCSTQTHHSPLTTRHSPTSATEGKP